MSQSCEVRAFLNCVSQLIHFYTACIIAFLCANTTIPRTGLGEPPGPSYCARHVGYAIAITYISYAPFVHVTVSQMCMRAELVSAGRPTYLCDLVCQVELIVDNLYLHTTFLCRPHVVEGPK